VYILSHCEQCCRSRRISGRTRRKWRHLHLSYTTDDNNTHSQSL